MDIDLKIGAVFSLADDISEPETETRNTEASELFDTPDFLLPDNDSDDEVDIMSSFNRTPPNKGKLTSPLSDHMCYTADKDHQNTDKSPNRSTSVLEDPDAPPSLLLEGHSSPGSPTPSSLIPGIDTMSPPILHREESVNTDALCLEHLQDEKKKCTKIDPCYIVLKNVNHVMKGKVSISYRTFKRSFIECSNMCKKIHFKRRLHAGKDVFNVKTPSKQKDYLFYLEQVEKKGLKTGKKKKIIQFTKLREILEKHDLKVAARKKAYGKPALPRIRRTVARLPDDFATRPKSPIIPQGNETDEVEKEISAEESERLNKLMIRKHHKVELDSLKKLISIKRSLNQNLKRTKRARAEGFENFLRSEVTSSVSGRVRKANPRYGSGEFALSRRDIEEQRYVEDAHARLKRTESESKRKVEDLKKNNERFKVSKKRKEFSGAEKLVSDQSDAAKKPKPPYVVIDNPEECNVKRFASKRKKLKKTAVDGHRNVDSNSIKTKRHEKNKKDRDGILIQDMPKEENVISGFLQNMSFDETYGQAKATPSSLVADSYIKKEPGYQQGDPYLRAKHLLKESIAGKNRDTRQKSSSLSGPVSAVASVSDNNQAIEQEKYKMLRIPENVQKLFTPKEIKKEPVDEESVTTNAKCMSVRVIPGVSSSNSPKVITVAYANGVNKKVLLNTSTVGQAASTTRAQTDQTQINHPPVLVQTQHGLRYLVPKQPLRKGNLPSYSEAIQAKSVTSGAVQNENSSTAIVTSAVTLNTKTSNESSVVRILKTLNVQHNHQQQERQANGVSALPSVAQVPVQIATSASYPSTSLRPILPGTVFTNQYSTNMSAQEPSGVIANSGNTALLQTNAHVLKVLPAAHSYVSQAQTVLSQADHVSKTPILQQTVSSTNNKGNVPGNGVTVAESQNQKPLDKCKFYLLKIDGKNVLIPIEGDQAQPKAYVVNSDILARNMQTPNLNTSTPVFTPSNTTSSTGTRPTIFGVPTVSGVTQQKPTLAVLPSQKQANNVFLNPITTVGNTVSSTQTKSLLQTVTLTNAGLVPGQTVGSVMINAMSHSSATASTKTPSVVRTDSNNLTTKSVGVPSDIVLKTTVPPTAVPVYLRKVSSPPASGNIQWIATAGNTKSPVSLVKNKVYFPANFKGKTTQDHSSQPVGLISDLLNQKESISGKQSLLKSVKTEDGNYDVSEKRNKEANSSVNSKEDELCQKPSQCMQNETSEDETEQSEEKPRAFKEAVTAREERLRHLKELLKEKQKAVEEIRSNKVKSD